MNTSRPNRKIWSFCVLREESGKDKRTVPVSENQFLMNRSNFEYIKAKSKDLVFLRSLGGIRKRQKNRPCVCLCLKDPVFCFSFVGVLRDLLQFRYNGFRFRQ